MTGEIRAKANTARVRSTIVNDATEKTGAWYGSYREAFLQETLHFLSIYAFLHDFPKDKAFIQ
jgi:hypothetical protein